MSAVTSQSSTRSRRPLSFLILATILTAATLALLPQAIEYGIKTWISEQGGDKVSVENIDFNPFTATFRIENLKIDNRDENALTLPKLDLQLEWLPLIHKQIVITGLELSGVDIKVNHDSHIKQITVGGMSFNTTPTENNKDDIPWQLKLDRIKLNNSTLTYKSSQLSSLISLDQLSLTDLNTINPEKPVTISLKGSLDKASISLSGKLSPFANIPNFSGQLSVKGLALAPYSELLKAQLNQIKGLLSSEGEINLSMPSKAAIAASYKGAFSLDNLLAANPDHHLSATQFAWQGELHTKPNSYRADGNLSTTGIQYQKHNTPLSYQHASSHWSGKLDLTSKTSQNMLTSSGSLKLTKPDLKIENTQITLEQAVLSLPEGKLILNDEEKQATLSGSLKIDGTHYSTPDNQLMGKSLTWDGRAHLSQATSGTSTAVDGNFKSTEVQLKSLQKKADIAYDDLEWQGSIKLDQANNGTTLKPAGNLQLQGLSATDNATALALLTVKSIDLEQINFLENGEITAQQIQIEDISTGAQTENESAPPILSLYRVNLHEFGVSPESGLRIAEIEAEGLQQQLVRHPDKNWNFTTLISSINRLLKSESHQPSPVSEPLVIAIQKLNLTGDNQIDFHDQSADPVYHTQLKPTQLSIDGISNHKTDTAAKIILKGILGESSTLDVAGSIAPFSSQANFDLTGRIEGLELPPLSAYTIPLMGYKLQSGKANSDIQLVAKAGEITGHSDLTLNQLEVEPLSAEKMAALQTQLSIPLESALGMLKDKNNQIKLDLPISGNAGSINVDPSDAINQAIGRAMKKGAKTYLATALFPFGTLLTLVELAGDAAAKVQLDPILFDPGSSNLKKDQHAYLEKVALLLNDRPEIHIRLCGVAVASDIQSLQQQEAQKLKERELAKEAKQEEKKTADKNAEPASVTISDKALNNLATDRATAIERHLSEEHNIKADRLISCLARIETENQEAAPRADLLI